LFSKPLYIASIDLVLIYFDELARNFFLFFYLLLLDILNLLTQFSQFFSAMPTNALLTQHHWILENLSSLFAWLC